MEFPKGINWSVYEAQRALDTLQLGEGIASPIPFDKLPHSLDLPFIAKKARRLHFLTDREKTEHFSLGFRSYKSGFQLTDDFRASMSHAITLHDYAQQVRIIMRQDGEPQMLLHGHASGEINILNTPPIVLPSIDLLPSMSDLTQTMRQSHDNYNINSSPLTVTGAHNNTYLFISTEQTPFLEFKDGLSWADKEDTALEVAIQGVFSLLESFIFKDWKTNPRSKEALATQIAERRFKQRHLRLEELTKERFVGFYVARGNETVFRKVTSG